MQTLVQIQTQINSHTFTPNTQHISDQLLRHYSFSPAQSARLVVESPPIKNEIPTTAHTRIFFITSLRLTCVPHSAQSVGAYDGGFHALNLAQYGPRFTEAPDRETDVASAYSWQRIVVELV